MNSRDFVLPDLGEGLTDAEIIRWLVAVGDTVRIDQPIVEVETAKAVVEVPSPYGGVVTRLRHEEGERVDVGQPLLSVSCPAGARDGGPTPDVAPVPHPVESSGNVLIGYGTSQFPARRRRPAPSRVATSMPAAMGGGSPDGPVRVKSPLVRRRARELEIDLRTVLGSGPGGLIVRKDIERVAAMMRQGHGSATGVRIPLRGVRRLVAEKLTRSRQEIPDATTWVDVDTTRLLDIKPQLASADGETPSLLAFLAYICVAGLARYPELNATVDIARQEIVRLPSINLGFAAQTGKGLIVPVVKNADQLSLGDLSCELARLTARAREGGLAPGELSGGTFTLNNYGVFGVDGSAPIINHPEAAMLGVGRILPRPWVVDGNIEIRQLCQLSLAFDHRVCDGGAAGGYLRYVADLVEQPIKLLGAR